eukprot:m.430243 g.430243  ORF g.430243 m.430243 type:complete len:216 (+) comp17134_c0_seq1:53-700(+)
MIRTTIAVAIAATVSTAYAQVHPRLCTSPEVFEGSAHAYDISLGETIESFVAFDSLNRRFYKRELVSTKVPGRKFYSELYFYNLKEYYKTDSSTGACYKGKIPADAAWRPFGVPENATFVSQVNIGAPDAFVIANEYTIPVAAHPNNFYYRGTFTAKECLPIQETLIKADGLDISKSEFVSFYNMVLGIANPNVFNVPVNCKDLSEEEMAALPRK